MRRPLRTLLFVALLTLGLRVTAFAQPAHVEHSHAAATAARVDVAHAPRLQLEQVQIEGRSYYRTFRVTSANGIRRITNTHDGFRFFGGGGQYAEGFYLFAHAADAHKMAQIEHARGTGRDQIAEVLLPKEEFDALRVAEVPAALDWGNLHGRNSPGFEGLRALRNNNSILFGRWAPSPGATEPHYDSLNGALQLSVQTPGLNSIVSHALIRQLNLH